MAAHAKLHSASTDTTLGTAHLQWLVPNVAPFPSSFKILITLAEPKKCHAAGPVQ
jgi:hypothetical protein